MKHKLILFSIVSSFITQSSQANPCALEAREYTEWSQKCDNATTAANIACIAGTATCWFTFGASLAAPAALVPVAMNMCRIRNEKNLNLTRCQDREKAKAEFVQWKIDVLPQRDAKVDALIVAYRTYAEQKESLWNAEFDQKIEQAISDYRNEGFDLESEESREHISQVVESINVERAERFIAFDRLRKTLLREGIESTNEHAGQAISYGLQPLIDAGII